MMNKIYVLLVVLICFCNVGFAQQNTTANNTAIQSLSEPRKTDFSKRQDFANRKPVPYLIRPEHSKEIMSLIQEIDLRDPANAEFASSKYNLMKIFYEAISQGELTAYDPTPTDQDDINSGEKFDKPMTEEEFKQRLNEIAGDSTLVDRYDDDGNVIYNEWIKEEFNPNQVTKFRIKEQWLFDEIESALVVKIIGIAPMYVPKIFEEGSIDAADPNNSLGSNLSNDDFAVPICWIYFDDAREILATKPAPSPSSFYSELSYDDIFIQRLFSSYIVREGDRRIEYGANREEGLKESERIKKKLIEIEQSYWLY